MNTLTNFDFVLFGATGDLAMRKLIPSLYQAHAAGLLHPKGRILGVSRSDFSAEDFLRKVEIDSKIHVKELVNDDLWASFVARICYLKVDVTKAVDFETLASTVNARAETDNVIVYLSIASKFFTTIFERLASVGLNRDTVRVVLEKPLGNDLISSQAINDAVGKFYSEPQIYRIDHYLGKESLQNLLVLRFGNVMFEPLWNRHYVKSVQLTIAEQLGVEERGEFYDSVGALRDMVQNHLVQMLCMIAMEPPVSLDADAVRDEKLKVIRALKTMTSEEVDANVVRGQYSTAEVSGKQLKGYLNEHKVPTNSHTETYVAIKAEINNERWAGVPFYVRTGKRMKEKRAEIVLNFHAVPNSIFANSQSIPNALVLELQPIEEIRLRLQVKRPGSAMEAVPALMNVNLAEAVPERRAEAYERLLLDVINGKLALFNRRDELEAAWAWVMPIMDNWAASQQAPHTYAANSWGPEAAEVLLAKDGNTWHENQ